MKALLIPTLAASLALGGCFQTSGGGVVIDPSIPPQPGVTSELQVIVARVCGFVPAVSVLQSILGQFSPTGALTAETAVQVATAVCGVLSPKQKSEVKRQFVRARAKYAR